jgi:tetratricopeptide (TPR) repeat protein
MSAIGIKQGREDLYHNILNELEAIPPKEQDFYVKQTIAHAYALFGYYIDKKYYPRAEAVNADLIEMSPYFTSTYQDLGRMYLRQKNYQRAIEQFNKGLAASPSISHPYLTRPHKQEIGLVQSGFYDLLGDAYNGEKNLPAALKAYLSAQQLNPFYLPIYKKIADVYYLQGDLKKAIKYNQRGYLLNPRDYNWPLALAVLNREEGDLAEAKRYGREAAAINPEADIIIKLLKELGDTKKSK